LGKAAKKPKSKAKPKNLGGRPTKYSENKAAIELLARRGFTDREMATCLQVTEQTFNNWKKRYPKFFESLKANKDIADASVERSLYERACGYSHPDAHISNYQGKITVTDITKHYAPDPTSMIFWLKNRQPTKWRDKQDINIGVKLEEILAALPESYARAVRAALGKLISD